MSPALESVARAFVEAINSGSPERLARLMTEDHVFVDSDGTEVRGRAVMADGWRDFFGLVPDYRITVKEIATAGRTVLLAGEAEGTFAGAGVLRAEDHWRVPAAWRAVVEGSRVAVWQVYVNPEPLARAFRRARRR
jgi:ketosteroid isomerase-like protein